MQNKGFTLIEVLVVVIIITTLTAIMLPQYRRALDRSKAAELMQVLPALFEARERWVIGNLCTWQEDGSLVCDDGGNLEIGKLDITVQHSTESDEGDRFETENFRYNLVVPRQGGQACVSARPLWGKKLGLQAPSDDSEGGAIVYYRGDKFSCKDDATIRGGCAILNVDNGKGEGSCH